jgi:hypothetical protein
MARPGRDRLTAAASLFSSLRYNAAFTSSTVGRIVANVPKAYRIEQLRGGLVW